MASSSVENDIKSVKNHFTLNRPMKGSPPIKLKRKSFGCAEVSADIALSSLNDSNNFSVLSGIAYNSDNDLNGCQRVRRLYKLHKSWMPRSVELNVVRSPVNDTVTGIGTLVDCDPLVAINSHSLNTLLSSSDNELESKKEAKCKKENCNGDSTPKLDVEIKLLKDESFRWSDSEFENKDEVYEMEPMFKGHQLVGDSQLLRFSQYILGIPRKVDSNGKGWLGFCVGGQRICDLHRRVTDGIIPMAKKLIVLIGTNDLLKGTTGSDMCRGLYRLLTTLYKTAEKIIVLTLPPVPKLAYLSEHWRKLKKYNEFIFSLKDSFKDKLDVIDVSPLFYQPKLQKCHLGFFELWFDSPIKRPDLIHINETGFKLMRDLISSKIG